MSRDLESVIGDMLGSIPKSERELISKLESIRNSCRYTAPDAMGWRWREAHAVLVSLVGEPDEQWKADVATAFAGKRIEVSQ